VNYVSEEEEFIFRASKLLLLYRGCNILFFLKLPSILPDTSSAPLFMYRVIIFRFIHVERFTVDEGRRCRGKKVDSGLTDYQLFLGLGKKEEDRVI
jgi:hypothetical protein